MEGGEHRLGIQRSRATPQHRCIGIVSCNWIFPLQGQVDDTIDMRVPPAWPLACMRQVDFLFWPFNPTLKREHILEVQEKDLRTGGTMIPLESLSSSFPGPIPTKWSTQEPQAANYPLFRGVWTETAGSLRVAGNPSLQMRTQSLVPYHSSLQQLARRCHT